MREQYMEMLGEVMREPEKNLELSCARSYLVADRGA